MSPPSDAWGDFRAAQKAANDLAAAERLVGDNIATLVVLAVQTVALQRPQELRKALSDVFQPFELEARYERLECRLNIAVAQQGELIDTLNRVEDRLRDMEKRLCHLESPPPNGRK